MKDLPKLDSTLQSALKHEKRYRWLDAANEYQKALKLQHTAEIAEKKAYALYRAAYQSRDNSQFKNTIQSSIEAYTQACKLYEDTSTSKTKRCDTG